MNTITKFNLKRKKNEPEAINNEKKYHLLLIKAVAGNIADFTVVVHIYLTAERLYLVDQKVN